MRYTVGGAGRYVMCKAPVVVSGKNRLIGIRATCAGGVRSCPGPSAQSNGDSSGFAGRPVAEFRCGVWMHGKERGRGSGLVLPGLAWLLVVRVVWCGRMTQPCLPVCRGCRARLASAAYVAEVVLP
jgi:hypothetical protein